MKDGFRIFDTHAHRAAAQHGPPRRGSRRCDSVMPHHVLEVLGHVPANRLMIGSDLPENTGTEAGKILTLDMPEGEKRQILSETADRVFGKP